MSAEHWLVVEWIVLPLCAMWALYLGVRRALGSRKDERGESPKDW